MKNKKVFICQITETKIKLIGCVRGIQASFTGLAYENLPYPCKENEIIARLENLTKRLGFSKDNKFIFTLPRGSVTSRFIRIPSQKEEEIENIAHLQASRYLPYPQENLISGYQIISKQDQGYSELNLIVLEKNLIDQYLRICNKLKIKDFHVYLSSCGLNNLANFLKIEKTKPAAVMELDSQNAELAIISEKKLLFSRSFKIKEGKVQIPYTLENYRKEIQGSMPEELTLFSSNYTGLENTLSQELNFPVNYINYPQKIQATDGFLKDLRGFEGSFASLIGLGLNQPFETLNLIPREIKEKRKTKRQERARLKLFMFIFSILLVWAVGLNRIIENKKVYLSNLKKMEEGLASDARPLEKIARRLNILTNEKNKKDSALEQLGAMYQLIPGDISLTGIKSEKNKSLVITGEAAQINSVFLFSKNISLSEVFTGYNVRVNYLSREKNVNNEVTEFEITCLKKGK